MTSPPFCPRGPSHCSPASCRDIGLQGGGCQGKGRKSPARLQAGQPEARVAQSCSCLCISQHPHLLAGSQGPRVLPLTGDRSLLHSARGGPRILAGSASCSTSAERHAEGHVFQALRRLSCLGLHSQRPDLQAAALHGHPHPCARRAPCTCLAAPAAAVPFPLPLFLTEHLSWHTALFM